MVRGPLSFVRCVTIGRFRFRGGRSISVVRPWPLLVECPWGEPVGNLCQPSRLEPLFDGVTTGAVFLPEVLPADELGTELVDGAPWNSRCPRESFGDELRSPNRLHPL